jgi:hypothetical protein
MRWTSLVDDRYGMPLVESGMRAARPGGERAPAGLGSARAGDGWHWAAPAPTAGRPARLTAMNTSDGGSALRMPRALLAAMRAAAQATGRSESAIWAEAASEWLARYRRDDGPQPPTPAAAALVSPARSGTWARIDALLAELRRSQPDTPAA